MQPRPYTKNEQIGRHEQEQTRTDMKRRTSISVKEKTTYDTRRIIYIYIYETFNKRHLQIAITPIGIPLCKIQLDSSNYLYLLPYSNFRRLYYMIIF